MKVPAQLERLLFEARLWPPDRWLVVYVARRWAAGGESARMANRAYSMLEEHRRLLLAIDDALEKQPQDDASSQTASDASLPGYEASYSDLLLCSLARKTVIT